MADNITSSAAFATSNMKPAAAGGENIDAVWGRNMADNTGYLYYRTMPQFGFGAYEVGPNAAGTWQGTYHFLKQPSYGSLSGSFRFGAGNSSSGFEVLVNGVSVKATNCGVPGVVAGSFSADISALTNGNWYQCVVLMKHAADTSNPYHVAGNAWCTV